MQNAAERMNDSGTCTPTRTESVQSGSLIVLAQHLLRQRSSLPPQRRPLVSNLIQQIYNYDANPDAMRLRILETIERLASM